MTTPSNSKHFTKYRKIGASKLPTSPMENFILKSRRRLLQVTSILNPAKRSNVAQFQAIRTQFYIDYWQSVAKNINADLEPLGQGFFKLTRNSNVTFVRNEFVMLDNHLVLKLSGNKPIIHKMLSQQKVPIPKYCAYELSSLSKAKQFMTDVGGSFVVKPAAETGGGNGVVTNVTTEKLLRKASLHASVFAKKLMIEQQVPGDSYRLLYLNGKLIDAVRKDPPTVTGDGKNTIKQLMKNETEKRIKSLPPLSMHPLNIDLECEFTLLKQGISLSTIPKKGEIIQVKKAPNQNIRLDNHIVTDEVHPSLVELGKNLVSMFGIQLAGVDVITTDISIPLSESGGVINEINSTPGLHHHHLIAEEYKRAPVGELVIESIFNDNAAIELPDKFIASQT